MIWLAAPDPKLDRRYFFIRDYKGQALTFVSFEEESGRRSAAHLLTRDEPGGSLPTSPSSRSCWRAKGDSSGAKCAMVESEGAGADDGISAS
jgi:hypothetical protein